jgi:hypothetical protein
VLNQSNAVSLTTGLMGRHGGLPTSRSISRSLVLFAMLAFGFKRGDISTPTCKARA